MKILRYVFTSGLGLALPLFALASECSLNGKEVPCESLTQGVGAWILGGGIVLLVIFSILALVVTVFWFWMLIHVIIKPVDNKAMWIILMIIFGIPVSIVYYFVVKRKFQEPPIPPVQIAA